jgi:hypothetical protein
MGDHNQEIKLSLNAEELIFILDYQLANKAQFKKLSAFKAKLLAKRPDFKRVNIILTLDDIDSLLTNITIEANKNNNSDENQFLLNSIWSKLATKYNDNVNR